MPTYVTLFKYTQQGITNIKGSPERLRKNMEAVQKAGGKLIGVWSTMGKYDMVAVSEWADDQAAASFVLAIGGQGSVSTMTMRAFTPDEFAQIVEKIPS
jgi:uncharacterized protein with GYD domain